ncbi:putative dipeptidyl-peptidase I [Medicago truncatula]|nr:putative dipeptidyl-peptidase I [Medicago truncatula]
MRKPCMWIETFMGFDLTEEISLQHNKKKIEKRIESEIQEGPVAAEMLWLPGMEHIKGEIYSGPEVAKDFDKAEAHGVSLVGFGEEKKDGKLIRFWVIQNSHGSQWGENGFGRIDRSPSHGRLLIHKVWIVRWVKDKK